MQQTLDGWTISTVEQQCRYAGEEMGKVWLHNPHTSGASQWRWYQADSVPDARRLAAQAATMTQEAFEHYYDSQE